MIDTWRGIEVKIDQDLVDKTFMVRNGTCGSYYEQDDVDKVKEHIRRTFGVILSNAEAVDFWRWRCAEWDGSWFGVDIPRDANLIEEYFQKFLKFVGVETDEDSPEISDDPPRIGVKILVKDVDGLSWEVELDPEYHSQLVQDIESQIPNESTGGSIRYSLEYDPTKIWSAKKLEDGDER
jgi:hypothetical protein